MSSMLSVLKARRLVLRRRLPPRITSLNEDTSPQDDAFIHETFGFYTTTGEVGRTIQNKSVHRPRPLPPLNAIRKSKTRTPELDRLLRKCLRKFGWGAWMRMEQTGLFPLNYSRTIIARRVKALGYTKAMVCAERDAHRK